ncbi:LysR family transcriptional regulator [Neobacillus bataviensis LMG 21833]|uniref:LysR family transcriptional regulator n=1 Tax=Neobacillus bataviensis LMG 21833 TaxID=1117379 RepID=K6DTR9_9BACI|nr:LysR family transcriptional regulator [Neobacillus bataviensis LMG 21833]
MVLSVYRNILNIIIGKNDLGVTALELKQLMIFQTAAQELNFTRTAEILCFAQSSITAHIKSLEEELGVPLFERLGKRVILSEAGHRFKLYADRIIQLSEEAKETVGGYIEPSGILTICASETQCTYRLPSLLSQFQSLYPKVQLVFRPGIAETEMEGLLSKGHIDAVLISMIPITSESLIVDLLIPEPIVIVSHPDHFLAKKPAVSPLDLEGQPLLVTEKCDYRRLFEESMAEAGAQPSSKLELGDVEAIKKCVIAGIGIAALPKIAVESEVAQGRMAILKWVGPDFPIVTQLVWHKDKWMSPALRAFLDVTREVILNKPHSLPL